ncbi:BspA family leucine-rich repeat surface protein [Rhodohalobacter sp. 8-1]|uniref:BspA family leucine-rich repeat surface protein n=1 Tax=Rhodohalobacter sp. 8-1 TaxID=3131972 RepID=UPI0030EC840B
MAKRSLLISLFLLCFAYVDVRAQFEIQLWTSNGDNKIQQLVEGTASGLITDGTITPWGLAVDQAAGKLYWSSVFEGTISRADLDGGNIETILSGLDLPRGIALDEITNTLFWAEGGSSSPGIKSVNLGESPLVVTDINTSDVVSPYHMAVDTERQYVYWVDNASNVKQINRIKYDGSGLETIITDVYVKQVAGITLNASGSTLYWSDFEDDLIYSANASSEDQNVQIVHEISDAATPWAMDVDAESESLYWTDYLNSAIYRINLSTSVQTELASGISTPSGFVSYSDQAITPGSEENFITTWISNNVGQSEDDEIVIPTDPGSNYYYEVFWEDVNDSTRKDTIHNVKGNLTIDFDEPGTYKVEIAGNFPRILFFDPNASIENQSIDPLKIISVDQWGNIQWTSMNHAFHGTSNLRLSASDAPELSGVEDMSFMFFGASSLEQIGDGALNNWDVSTIRNFDEMFSGATEFNDDISDWETGNAVQMNGMFKNNQFFNSDLSGWNVSKVERFDEIFLNAKAFNSDISGWQTGSATLMEAMFQNAESFDQDLGAWDVGKVTKMENMLNNSGLSVGNYDKTLIGWNNQSVQSDVNLYANGLQYCRGEGAEARQSLIDNYMWSIVDAGLADSCIPTDVERVNDLPTDFSLNQNYPNPFNPTTQINFDLPEAGEVKVVIFDLTGRAVRTLVNRNLSAGSHQVMFDASQLSSGVYLYRLLAPGFTSTRKMMLVK